MPDQTGNYNAFGYNFNDIGNLFAVNLGLGGGLFGDINNQLNVVAYGAVGDGSTDDTAALQAAIVAACGGTLSAPGAAPHPEVYFPYTGHAYYHTKPLHVPCGQISLTGPHQASTAALKQNYIGSAMLPENYGAFTLQYGAALVGSGNSLNMQSYHSDGFGFVDYTPVLNALAVASMNGLTAFNIHYVVEPSGSFAAADQNQIFCSSATLQSNENGATIPAFCTYLGASSGVLHATLNMSGGAVTFPTTTLSLGTKYEIELNVDGSGHCQEFINGTQNGGTQACSGHLVMDPYEVITAPSTGITRWPHDGFTFSPANGLLDCIKVEGASVHTSNYTPNTSTKPTSDSNTLLLDNFISPTSQTQDTENVTVGASTQGYLNILPSNAGQIGGTHISYLELCAAGSTTGCSGLFSYSEYQHEYDHLSVSNNSYIGIDDNGVPYESYDHDNSIQGGSLCLNLKGFAEGVIGNNLCNQAGAPSLHTCYNSDSSSMVDIYNQCQDADNPGDIIAPWTEYLSHNQHLFPFLDAEFGNSTVMKASFAMVNSDYAPSSVTNPEGNVRNGAPFILQTAGYPYHVSELYWANQPAIQLFDILTPPNGPNLVENSVLPASGNNVCTAPAAPLACCTGVATGTCPTPPLANLPQYVDSIDNTYDNGTDVTNLLNGGLTVPILNAGYAILGAPGFNCQQTGTTSNSGGTMTIARPPCSQPGVVEVCVVETGSNPTLGLSGWANISSVTTGDNAETMAAWWRQAPTGEGSTISITGATQQGVGICGVLSGVDPIRQVDIHNANTTNFASVPISVVAPSLSTTSPQDIVLNIGAFHASANGPVTASGAPSGAVNFAASNPNFSDYLNGYVWGAAGSSSAAVTYTYNTAGADSAAIGMSIAFVPNSSLGMAPALPQNPEDIIVGNSLRSLLIYGIGTPGISGGGALATGSNSFAGTITGLAATGNVLTPGFQCPNGVVAIFQDDTTAGGVLITARSSTTVTFSATASDTADYIASCR